MKLDEATCRRLVQGAAVARLATTGADQLPHLVPVTFAITGDTVIIGIDQKPKSTTNLRRLRNLAENPRVALLCDHYEDDWTRLWWVRLDGLGAVLGADPERAAALAPLVRKYPQYQDDPPAGPVIRISVQRWTGWSGEPG